MIVNKHLNNDQSDSDEILLHTFQKKRESVELVTQNMSHNTRAYVTQNDIPTNITPYKESISTFSNTLNQYRSKQQTTPNKFSRQFKKQNDGFNSVLDFQDDNKKTAVSQISTGQGKFQINYHSNSSVPDVNTQQLQSKNIVSYGIPDLKGNLKQQSHEHLETFDKQILNDKKSKKQQFVSMLTNRNEQEATPLSQNKDTFPTTLNQSNDFDFMNSQSLQMVNGQDSKETSQYDTFKFQKTQSQVVSPARSPRVIMQSQRQQNFPNFNFTQSQPLFTGEVSVIENTRENNQSYQLDTSSQTKMNQTNFLSKTFQAINNEQLKNLSKLYQNKQIKALITKNKKDLLQINRDLSNPNMLKISENQSLQKSICSQYKKSKVNKSLVQQPIGNNLKKDSLNIQDSSQNEPDNLSDEYVTVQQDLLQNIDKISQTKRFGVRNNSQISKALHGTMDKPNKTLFMQKMSQKRSTIIIQENKSVTELITRQIPIQGSVYVKPQQQIPDEPPEMGDQAKQTKQENDEQIMQKIKLFMETIMSQKQKNKQSSEFDDLQIAFRKNSLLFKQVLAFVNQITGQEQLTNSIQIDKNSPGLVGNKPLKISLNQGTDLTLQVKIEGKKAPLNFSIIDGLDQVKKQNAKKSQMKFVEKIISPFEIYWSFTNKKPSEVKGEHDGSFSYFGDAFKIQPFFSIQPRGIKVFNPEQYQNMYITIQTKRDSNIQADLLIGFGEQFNQEQLQRQIINYIRSQQNKEKQRLESIEKQQRNEDAGISNNPTSLDNFYTDKMAKQKNNTRLKAFKQNVGEKLQHFMLKASDREAFFKIVEEKKNPFKNVQEIQMPEIQVLEVYESEVQQELAAHNQDSFFDNQNKLQDSMMEIEQSFDEYRHNSGVLTTQQSKEILKKNVTYDEPYIKNTSKTNLKNSSVTFKKKNYFEKCQQDQKQTENLIKIKDLQLYKFNLFMTIRKQLIRSLKDQSEQQQLELTRKIKNHLRLSAQIKLQQVISNLFNNFRTLSERKFQKIRFYLAKYKLQAHFLKVMKWRYGFQKEIKALKQETQDKVNKKMLKLTVQKNDDTFSQSPGSVRGGHNIDQVFEALKPKLEDMINQSAERKTEETPRVKPLPDYLIKKLMRQCIHPTFRFQLQNTQKTKDIYKLAPKIIQWFLFNKNKKRQIILKVEKTVEKIIFIQTRYRNQRDKKKRWAAEIFIELEKEKKRMIYFIQLITNVEVKEKLQWFLDELNNLNNKYLKEVAFRLIQTIKDLNVIDTYRYRLQFLQLPITYETFNGLKKTILIFKKKLYKSEYLPHLSKYPLFLQKDSSKTLKRDDSQDSIKTKKKKPKEDDDQKDKKIQKSQPKMSKLIDLVKNSYKTSRASSLSSTISDPLQRYITIQELEMAYLELNIHMDVYLPMEGGFMEKGEPQINVQNVIHRMQQQTGFMAQMAYIERNIGQPTKAIKSKSDKVYEFSNFRELIIFACIDQKMKQEQI